MADTRRATTGTGADGSAADAGDGPGADGDDARTTDPTPRGPGGVLVALDVRRQAVRGFGVGILLAALVYAFFVSLPGSVRPAPFYVMLAFVFAVTTGLLATSVLVLVAAVHRDPSA